MSDTQQTAVDHDVQTQCGECKSLSFRLFEDAANNFKRIECDHCGEVYEL